MLLMYCRPNCDNNLQPFVLHILNDWNLSIKVSALAPAIWILTFDVFEFSRNSDLTLHVPTVTSASEETSFALESSYHPPVVPRIVISGLDRTPLKPMYLGRSYGGPLIHQARGNTSVREFKISHAAVTVIPKLLSSVDVSSRSPVDELGFDRCWTFSYQHDKLSCWNSYGKHFRLLTI